MKDFIDKTTTQAGTPINRESMMAIQGFQSKQISFGNNGSITETNSDGHTLTTTFGEDGTITEVFVGEKTITRRTRFMANGISEEVIE